MKQLKKKFRYLCNGDVQQGILEFLCRAQAQIHSRFWVSDIFSVCIQDEIEICYEASISGPSVINAKSLIGFAVYCIFIGPSKLKVRL